MTASDLLLLAEVRRLYRSGEAREARELSGVTQTEFAAAINVSPSAVSLWEAGARIPRGAAALRAAAVLNMLKGRAAA